MESQWRESAFPGMVVTPETHESDTMIEADVTFHCIALALVFHSGMHRGAPRDAFLAKIRPILARLIIERTCVLTKPPHSGQEMILFVAFFRDT